MREKRKTKEKVRVLERKLKTGTFFYLLYTLPNGKRVMEATGLHLYEPAYTAQQRELNAEAKVAVEKLKSDRTNELINAKVGIEAPTKSQKKLLLADYIEIRNKASQRAKKTQRGYLNLLKHIEEFSPEVRVSEIDKDWVKGFLSSLCDLKPSSKRFYYTLLSAVLSSAVKENIIASNPVQKLTADEKPKVKKTKREYLTPEEVEELVEAYPKNTKEQKEGLRMFLFALYTGLRWSDVAKFKWSDLKKDKSNGKYYFNIEMQKTKELVRGYLSNKVLDLIGTIKKSDEFVFTGQAYGANVNKCLKIATEKAGINKNVSFHTARHSFAVNLLASGKFDIYAVSKLLGHTDIKTTQIYLELVPKKQIEASDVIDEIF